MRGAVRAFSSLLFLLPVFLLPSAANSQERQIVVTEGADYFGADYDVRQDVDLDACSAACIGDQQCQAFTYNNSARWCFLKNAVGELRAVEGATSGKIVVAAAAEPQPDVEAERISELTFVAQSYIDEARHFVGQLSEASDVDGGLEAALANAQTQSDSGDYLTALDSYKSALKIEPNRLDIWTSFTDTAIRASSDDWEVKQTLSEYRTAGAINSYLHSVSDEDRAYAMELIGWALADRYDWKPAIKAYRASLDIVDNPDRRSVYDNIISEHGFRIIDNTVEADAAAPRICVNFSDQLVAGRDYSDFLSIEGGNNLAIESTGQQICIDGVEHGRRYRVVVREGLPAADGEVLAGSADLDIFVRDRAPSVRFLGTAYVLPAGGEPTIPIVSVNTNRVNAKLFRIGDRQLADIIADGTFLTQLAYWETDDIEAKSGVKVWEGTVDVGNEVNREITTAIPVGEMEKALKPGAYILTADARNSTGEDWAPKATQWFIVTDLGLTTLSGNDGLHVMVRSLGTRRAGRRRARASGRGQQRDFGRSHDRRRRLCAACARPDARHRRHGAGPARRRHAGRRLLLPRPLQVGDGSDRPRRRRPRAAKTARRVPDHRARHLPRRRDGLRDRARARRHGRCG